MLYGTNLTEMYVLRQYFDFLSVKVDMCVNLGK